MGNSKCKIFWRLFLVVSVLLLFCVFYLIKLIILGPCLPSIELNKSYSRDIYLLLEYEGKEYEMKSTIKCIDKGIQWRWVGGVRTEETEIIWETSIANNKLNLAGGEELELKMLFFNGDKAEKFYRDGYVEKLKEKLDQCYDEKTGYYSKVLEGDRFTVILASEHLSMNYYPELKKFIIGDNLKIKEYKISKRY